MNSLETILERYAYSGIDPLEDWASEDLAELETLINAELQERTHTPYIPGCPCPSCRAINQAEGRA
jgi:hypothetical protein